jgi:hypothetical protein
MIGNEPIWIEVNCKGLSGENYFGRFRVKKYLTHMERAEAVRMAEILCRGIVQDINLKTLLSTIAFLNEHILETDAKWWEGDEGKKGVELVDEEPVWALAEQINKAQKPQADKTAEETAAAK